MKQVVNTLNLGSISALMRDESQRMELPMFSAPLAHGVHKFPSKSRKRRKKTDRFPNTSTILMHTSTPYPSKNTSRWLHACNVLNTFIYKINQGRKAGKNNQALPKI